MFNFPSAPNVGQKFSPGAGLPVYGWDGTKWTTFTPDLASNVAPSDANPPMDSVASAGSSGSYARGDHRHPVDTSRAGIDSVTFTGTLTAAFVNATNVNVGGKLTSTAKQHLFGWARGNLATGAVVRADANILLYDHGEGSWAGVATDPNGYMWFRTGYSPSVAPIFYVQNEQTVVFRDSPRAPTPGAGDNSTRLATTAYVMGRAATGFPLAGGTITGNLTIANPDLWVHNGGNYGVLYLGNLGSRYLQWDGATYNLSGAHAYAGQGRLYGNGDFGGAMPYNNARLAYVGEITLAPGGGLNEPYGGSARTGATGFIGGGGGGNWRQRYRQFQYYTNGWFAIGYA